MRLWFYQLLTSEQMNPLIFVSSVYLQLDASNIQFLDSYILTAFIGLFIVCVYYLFFRKYSNISDGNIVVVGDSYWHSNLIKNELSHEVKNPLLRIFNPFSNFLPAKGISKLNKSNVGDTDINFHELVVKISELFQDIEHNLNSRPSNINLYDHTRLLVSDFGSFASSKNIDLRFHYAANNQLVVSVDKCRYESILRNIIFHLIYHNAENGSVTVSVLDYKSKFIISIKDNGVGLSSDDIKDVFKKQNAGSKLDGLGNEYNGIGLHYIKEHLRKLRGEIAVESELGVGTEFKIQLPKIEVITKSINVDEYSNEEVKNSNKSNLRIQFNNLDMRNDNVGYREINNTNNLTILNSQLKGDKSESNVPSLKDKLDNAWLQEVQKDVDLNISNLQYGVEALADNMNISRTQLFRKLKALVGKSPNHYIRERKLLRAQENLLSSKYNSVKEVAMSVGISKSSYFSKLFFNRFGVKPSAYLNS